MCVTPLVNSVCIVTSGEVDVVSGDVALDNFEVASYCSYSVCMCKIVRESDCTCVVLWCVVCVYCVVVSVPCVYGSEYVTYSVHREVVG